MGVAIDRDIDSEEFVVAASEKTFPFILFCLLSHFSQECKRELILAALVNLDCVYSSTKETAVHVQFSRGCGGS
jgi:hypothetical protein